MCALPRWREGRLERWVALVHNQERSLKKGLSRHLCCCCCCCWSGTKITPIRCRYIHKNPYAAQCIFLSSFFLVSSQGRLLEIPLTRSSQNVCYTSYRYYISVRRNFFFFTRRLDKALEKKSQNVWWHFSIRVSDLTLFSSLPSRQFLSSSRLRTPAVLSSWLSFDLSLSFFKKGKRSCGPGHTTRRDPLPMSLARPFLCDFHYGVGKGRKKTNKKKKKKKVSQSRRQITRGFFFFFFLRETTGREKKKEQSHKWLFSGYFFSGGRIPSGKEQNGSWKEKQLME